MVAKIAILAAALVAVTPAVATLMWPANRATDEVQRSVALDGPIIGFTQSHDSIQVRLVPTTGEETRGSVIVRKAGGTDEISIPLKRGQTWATAKLPQALADASALEISVR